MQLTQISVGNLTDFKTFDYQFDYVTIIVGLTTIPCIPSIYCLSKILIFYKNKYVSTSPQEIHPFIFRSFIWMQIWNLVFIFFDYVLVRIPSTTILTYFCATLDPAESIVPLLVAVYYFSNYSSQLYTVLFCSTRTLILFNEKNKVNIQQLNLQK